MIFRLLSQSVCPTGLGLYTLTTGIVQSFVGNKGFHSFSCLLHTCKWLDIALTSGCLVSLFPNHVKDYQSAAATKTYPGLRTVHLLSSRGHLFPPLCTQAAPCSNLCNCSHFSGQRGSCVGTSLHGFDNILLCQPQGLIFRVLYMARGKFPPGPCCQRGKGRMLQVKGQQTEMASRPLERCLTLEIIWKIVWMQEKIKSIPNTELNSPLLQGLNSPYRRKNTG